MKVRVFGDKRSLSQAAAEQAALAVSSAIQERGLARIIVATGASQLDFLEALTPSKISIGKKSRCFTSMNTSACHSTIPASFRKYLSERLINKVGISAVSFAGRQRRPKGNRPQCGEALQSAPIDVAFVGIGENGHLAFNDPPANFETEEPYLIVELDEPCRRQQVGEGWFADISEVPPRAISMSVRQILKANEIICIVPDARKAHAVKLCLEGEINPMAPASILRTHPRATIFLDTDSAATLGPATITALTANA